MINNIQADLEKKKKKKGVTKKSARWMIYKQEKSGKTITNATIVLNKPNQIKIPGTL